MDSSQSPFPQGNQPMQPSGQSPVYPQTSGQSSAMSQPTSAAQPFMTGKPVFTPLSSMQKNQTTPQMGDPAFMQAQAMPSQGYASTQLHASQGVQDMRDPFQYMDDTTQPGISAPMQAAPATQDPWTQPASFPLESAPMSDAIGIPNQQSTPAFFPGQMDFPTQAVPAEAQPVYTSPLPPLTQSTPAMSAGIVQSPAMPQAQSMPAQQQLRPQDLFTQTAPNIDMGVSPQAAPQTVHQSVLSEIEQEELFGRERLSTWQKVLIVTVAVLTLSVVAGAGIWVYVTITAPAAANVPIAGKDTDGDGLSDIEERNYGTNPNSKDTDGDGYLDGEEIKNGYSPLRK